MRFRILLLTTIAVPSAPVLAQEAAAVSDADTIIVTGTRRLDRTVADSPVPVDVVGLTSIQNSGQTETARALRDLVPSFNFPQPAIADGSDALRPATPSPALLRVADAMFSRALAPLHPSCDDALSPLARQAAYVRAHWLRMPAHLLLPHLFHKAFVSPWQDDESPRAA
jgi:hypothetical protein